MRVNTTAYTMDRTIHVWLIIYLTEINKLVTMLVIKFTIFFVFVFPFHWKYRFMLNNVESCLSMECTQSSWAPWCILNDSINNSMLTEFINQHVFNISAFSIAQT